MKSKIAVAFFTIQEYRRGTWFLVEVLLTGAFIFLYSDHYWSLEANEVFLGLGIYAIVAAVLTTLRVTNRETNSRIHIILTRSITRRDYIFGKMLAILLIDTLFLLLLFIFGFILTKLSSRFSLFEAFGRLGFVVLVFLLAEMITLLFSPLIKSSSSIPIGLSLIVLGIYQPAKFLEKLLPPIQQFIKATYSPFEPGLIFDIFLYSMYIVVFWYLINYFFNRREIDFESK